MGTTWRTGRARHTGTFGTRPVEVIAHRGANREAPENTIEAFERALELDVDGIELDIQFTKDQVPVVHHDAALQKPAGGARDRIGALTLEEVRARSAAPTLDAVLDLVAGRCRLYLEVKDPHATDPVVRRLAGREEWCAVHSFDHRVVARAGAENGQLVTGILVVSRLMDPAGVLRGARATDFWQQHELLDPPLVEEVHSAGGRVIAWTVNDAAVCRRLIDIGVDGLCTDAPRELLSTIRRASES